MKFLAIQPTPSDIQYPKQPREYHMGYCRDYADGYCRDSTVGAYHEHVIVQLRRCIDYLSCELWIYKGIYHTTKSFVRKYKKYLLEEINAELGTNFTRITID